MNPRYQILGPIAEGGRGEVLRGWDSHLGREVAIKKVRTDASDGADESAMEDLIKEARTLSTLNHPNVVSVYDVGLDEEGAYIVMELVKGETLEDIVSRGAMTVRDFDSLVNQTLEGMIAAHAAGLIHLDLKPQNLMITWLASGAFQVKILDFGLAMAAAQPVTQQTDEEGGIFGSIYFMAPEQFERSPVGPRTDLYSLGCIFYYALTKQYPFQGHTAPEVMTSHLYHQLTPLAKLRPDLTRFYHQWVDWLSSRQAENRPSSTAEALKAFRQKRMLGQTGNVPLAAAGNKVASSTAPVVRRPQPAVRPSVSAKVSKITIPILLVSILVFGSWYWVRQAGEKNRAQRLNELAAADAPVVNVADVRLILSFMSNPSTGAGAAMTLSKVRGDAAVENEILSAVQKANTQLESVNLLNVVTLRGMKGAYDVVLQRLGDPDVEIQKAAWNAIGTLATADQIQTLLEKAENVPEAVEKFAEQALVSVVDRAKDREQAVIPVVNLYQSSLGSDRFRAMLVRMLGRMGGRDSMKQLAKAIESGSLDVRKAAITSIAQWPDHVPVDLLAKRFQVERDPASRLLILMGISQLLSLPGPVPQEELLESVKFVMERASDRREKDQVITALSRLETPEVIAVLDQVAQNDPPRAKQIEGIKTRINETLERLVKFSGPKADLMATLATYNRSTFLMLASGALIQWKNPNDYASWLVQVDEPGDYTLKIVQSSTAQAPGVYEILFAGKKIESQSVNTEKDRNFKTFELGVFSVERPGIHRVMLKARQVPADESIFNLRSLILEKT